MEDSTPVDVIDTSFFKRVTTIEDDQKDSLINGLQYAAMATIPVAIVDNIMRRVFVEEDAETKGTLELLAEIFAQVGLTIVLMFAIHKVILALPTYTGKPINRINYTTLSLGLLISMFSMNHIVKTKMEVVFVRLMDMWDGKVEKKHTGETKVLVSQPISGKPIPSHAPSRADYLGTQNQTSMMPTHEKKEHIPTVEQHMQNEIDVTSQQNYGGPENTLIDANMPTLEPMAANGVLGGGGWGSW
jgi:hypothetical protein